MAVPTISVLVDWDNNGNFTDTNDDITADVGGIAPGVAAVSVIRGGSADFGSGSSRGGATIIVRNDAGKYTLDNGSSPLTGKLRVGRPVWITAVYSAVTYGVFAGYISRIVPDPVSKMATIVCSDAMDRFARLEASVTDSTTRSLKDYRGAILDAVGEVSTRRDLADEPEIPGYSGERTTNALDLLTEINESTLSRHFVRPGTAMPDWYFYTVRDRHYKLDEAVTLTFPDNLHGMASYDTSDHTLINDQFARPVGRGPAALKTVWTMPELPLSIPAGTSRTVWVTFEDPVLDGYLVSAATGSPVIVLTPLGTTAKIDITAGVAALITELSIVGRPYERVSVISYRAEDAASIAAYDRYLGSDITASLLSGIGQAAALADHMVYRFRAPRPRPVATIINQFPTILQALPFEPVEVTFSRLSLTSKRFEITGTTLDISSDRNTWTMDLQLQEAPEQTITPPFFTLNTDTLGSSARLGY